MTAPFTKQVQDERVPPQWLVGVFLVLLGVAVVAAIPASVASARGTAEFTKAAQGLAERVVVRAKIKIRVLPTPPSTGNDLALVGNISPPIISANDRIVPRVEDAGTRIAQCGTKIRAPPTDIA